MNIRAALTILVLPLFFQLHAKDRDNKKTANSTSVEIIAKPPVGQVRGTSEKDVFVWRGIPYGQAPVGDLRFKAPLKFEPWTGVRDAFQFGPAAMQSPNRLLKGSSVSEDCLFLNIWSPGADDKKRPVMVWIHGGGFQIGHGADDLYNGANLSSNGDVVVVTLNYRMGVFGFLFFDKANGLNSNFDNNLGIRDQIAALKWVKENIRAFGGDPDNVTIFGESAGGTSVQTIMAIPEAKGLFHAAIAQSGPSSVLWHKEAACNLTNKFLEIANLKPGQTDELKKIPTDSLVVFMEKLNLYMATTTERIFSPTIDGDFIVNDIAICLSPKQSGNIPLLIGVTKDESSIFASKRLHMVPVNEQGLDREFFQLIPADAKNKITSSYLLYPKRKAILDLLTDGIFRIPSVRVAECQSMHSPVYMYRFDWSSFFLNMAGLRAFHGLEIPFVFGNNEGKTGKLIRMISSKKVFNRLSGEMQNAWINFARYHNPNAAGSNTWKNYSADDRSTMIYNKTSEVQNDPGAAQRIAWDGVKYY